MSEPGDEPAADESVQPTADVELEPTATAVDDDDDDDDKSVSYDTDKGYCGSVDHIFWLRDKKGADVFQHMDYYVQGVPRTWCPEP